MTYILSTNSPGDETTYRKVSALVDDRPEGMVARYAGSSGAGLSITVVWESKAHADRFTAEQLVPALQQVVGGTGLATTIIEFETFESAVAASAAS